MELRWKLCGSETRDNVRRSLCAARTADGFVFREQWWQLGSKAHWAGMDEWTGGTPDQLLKERFGLTQEECVLHSENQLMETLLAVPA